MSDTRIIDPNYRRPVAQSIPRGPDVALTREELRLYSARELRAILSGARPCSTCRAISCVCLSLGGKVVAP